MKNVEQKTCENCGTPINSGKKCDACKKMQGGLLRTPV